MGSTNSVRSGLGSNGNEGVLHILQISKTEISLSDSLGVIPRKNIGERFYRSVVVQSAYSKIQIP